MFLNILEDGSKITRFWSELTMRTHHVKLPWEKQSSLNSTPAIFRFFYWDLLMVIMNQSFRETWSSWIQKYIVDRNMWYSGGKGYLGECHLVSSTFAKISFCVSEQTSFLTEQNLWFQRLFLPNTRKYA